MEEPQQWVRASFPLNVQGILNGIGYKLMALFMQKAVSFEHVSGGERNCFFKLCPK